MAGKVSVECPGCFAKLNLPDRSKLGKKIKCPKCSEVFVAEAPDDEDDYEEELLDEDEAPARSSGGRKRGAAGGKKGGKGGSSGDGSKTPLIIGAVAGVVLLVGGGLFFAGVFGGGNQPLPAPPVANAAPAPNPTPVAAPAPRPAAPPISADEKMLALRWMPTDTELLLHVKVSEIWQAPLLKGLVDNPQTVQQIQEMQKIGVGPGDIESITFGMSDLKGLQSASMMAAMGMPAPPKFKGLVVVRSKKALSQSEILKASPEFKTSEHNGKTYIQFPTPSARPGQPADQVGGWVADANTFVLGSLNELKDAMTRGETVTPRKELTFVDAKQHVVLVVAPKDPKAMSPGQQMPPLPGMPPQIMDMQTALNESMQGFGLGASIRGGFDLQTSFLLKNADGTQKVKVGLDAALVEGRKQFEVVKSTAPPLLGDLGQMLLDNLKIDQQSQVVKVSTSIPDSAQQQLEQLPPVLMMMAMTGGLGGAGSPNPFGADAAPPNVTLNPGAANFSPGSFGEMKQPGETEAVDSVKGEGLPDGVTLTAKSSWSAFPNFSADGKQAHPVEIMLDLKGDGIKGICAYGNVSAKTISLEGGGTLKVTKQVTFGQADPTKSLVPYDADQQFSFDHPEGTLRVKFAVDPPTGMATKIAALEGTFKFVTAEKSDEFTIDDAPKKALRPLQDPELKAAGVKLLLQKGSQFGGESLTLSCGKANFLGKAAASNSDDPMGMTMMFNPDVDKGQPVQKLQAFDQGGKFPEKMQIKFKLHRDVKEQTVSFRFENVPLPSPESKPKVETGTQQQNPGAQPSNPGAPQPNSGISQPNSGASQDSSGTRP